MRVLALLLWQHPLNYDSDTNRFDTSSVDAVVEDALS